MCRGGGHDCLAEGGRRGGVAVEGNDSREDEGITGVRKGNTGKCELGGVRDIKCAAVRRATVHLHLFHTTRRAGYRARSLDIRYVVKMLVMTNSNHTLVVDKGGAKIEI